MITRDRKESECRGDHGSEGRFRTSALKGSTAPFFRGGTLSCFCLPAREDAEQSSNKRDLFVSWPRKLATPDFPFVPVFQILPFFPFFFICFYPCSPPLLPSLWVNRNARGWRSMIKLFLAGVRLTKRGRTCRKCSACGGFVLLVDGYSWYISTRETCPCCLSVHVSGTMHFNL